MNSTDEEKVSLKELHEKLKRILEQSDPCMVKDRIAAYLKMMGLKFEWSDELNAFIVPYKIDGHFHVITIRIVGNWIVMSAGILPAEDIPKDKKLELFETILKANHSFPEFSYDIDAEGNVGYTQNIFIPALTFDVFSEEFLSIPVAIRYFWEKIFPMLGREKPKKTDFIYI